MCKTPVGTESRRSCASRPGGGRGDSRGGGLLRSQESESRSQEEFRSVNRGDHRDENPSVGQFSIFNCHFSVASEGTAGGVRSLAVGGRE